MGSLRVRRPLPDHFPIISPYGKLRQILINGKLEESYHQGIDFRAPIGTPIYSMVDGFVHILGWQDDKDHKIGMGLRVWQQFTFEGAEYYCWYGHLSKYFLREGQNVNAGDTIAYSGNSGHVEGPHLHVQFRKLNTWNFIDCEFESWKL